EPARPRSGSPPRVVPPVTPSAPRPVPTRQPAPAPARPVPPSKPLAPAAPRRGALPPPLPAVPAAVPVAVALPPPLPAASTPVPGPLPVPVALPVGEPERNRALSFDSQPDVVVSPTKRRRAGGSWLPWIVAVGVLFVLGGGLVVGTWWFLAPAVR